MTHHAPEADILQHLRHVIHKLRAVWETRAATGDEGAIVSVYHTCTVDGEPPNWIDRDASDTAVFPVPVRARPGECDWSQAREQQPIYSLLLSQVDSYIKYSIRTEIDQEQRRIQEQTGMTLAS